MFWRISCLRTAIVGPILSAIENDQRKYRENREGISGDYEREREREREKEYRERERANCREK